MRRIFHHYESLEECRAGFWRFPSAEERKPMVFAAAWLLAEPRVFRIAVKRVVVEWPFSCEHNLTAAGANRIAWLGQASCCIALGVPEELTRLAWHSLTPTQQDEANRVAAEALQAWETLHISRTQEDTSNG